jgi:NAD(P)-dependent dehydrogenase (short-subunit alcohol dehydrogenase family)
VVSDIDKERVELLGRELAAAGYDVLAIICGVSDDAQVSAMVQQAVEKCGKLDMAYNNAGIQPQPAELAAQTPEDYAQVMDINLHGVCCYALNPLHPIQGSRISCFHQRNVVITSIIYQRSNGCPDITALLSSDSQLGILSLKLWVFFIGV